MAETIYILSVVLGDSNHFRFYYPEQLGNAANQGIALE